MIDEGESYRWKERQRQLDPDSERTWQGIVWLLAATAGFLFALWLVA